MINTGINKYNNRNTVQEFINDMVGNTNVPTVVESCNEVTAASIFGKAKPVAVHENNHGNINLADTGLKSNHTLGAHIMEKMKDGSTDGLTNMMCGTITPTNLQMRMRMNLVAHICSQEIIVFLN